MSNRLARLTYTICLALPLFAGNATASPSPADSLYKSWYFTPTGVFGRLPLSHPKSRHYISLSHPAPDQAVIAEVNPAGITTNTTRIYFRNGLIALSTVTDRWGDTYDSIWFKPESPEKFLVTERRRGVNPYLPCKYLQYSYRNDLLVDILCYADSIRPGSNQEGVAHYMFERYDDAERRGLIKTETFNSEIDAAAFSRIADCHKIINEYDSHGHLITRSIYDQDDKPIPDRFGVFRTKYKYDGDDNLTEKDFFDPTDKAVVSKMGYAVEYMDYKHGFPSEESYYADARIPSIAYELGTAVSVVDHKYDENGDETSTTYYNTQRTPVNNNIGLQEIDNGYSASGMLNRRTIIPVHGDMGERSKVYLTVTLDHDVKGRLTGEHVETNTGYIVSTGGSGSGLTKYSYDAWGRVGSTSFWLNDSTKLTSAFGYHEMINHYDNDGQLSSVDFRDPQGDPATTAIGFSRKVIRRNAVGLMAEVAFFDVDKPVLLAAGHASISNFHRIAFSYDQLNRLRSIRFYDQNGQPVTANMQADQRHHYTAREIELNYSGDFIKSESLKGPGDSLTTPELNCSSGQCFTVNSITSPVTRGSTNSRNRATYHGHLHTDTIFNGQIAFVGRDSVLVFLTEDRGNLVDKNCSQYYRLAPLNKFYQPEGLVTDYFMDNDSIAASFNYVQGSLNGPVYIFYHNGIVKEKGTYKANVRTGLWEYYFDNGQKERVLDYQDGIPLMLECYSRNGDVLAKNGNGRFEGMVATADINSRNVLAKGNVKDGLPDGEWNFYSQQMTVPSNTEQFSKGKFRHGVSNALTGKYNYSNQSLGSFEGRHDYEFLDNYAWLLSCGTEAPWTHNLYAEIRQGFATLLQSNKYPPYSGWVFLDLRVGANGGVVSSSAWLHQPDSAFERGIREMAAQLPFKAYTGADGKGAPYEKTYIVLIDRNQIVIPEELVAAERLNRRANQFLRQF